MKAEEIEHRIVELDDHLASLLTELHIIQAQERPITTKIESLYNEKYTLERRLIGVQKAKPKGFRFKTVESKEVKVELSSDLNELLAVHGVTLKGTKV